MTIRLSNRQARQLILHLQGLTHPPHTRLDGQALYALIRQLGFVQVDSIQWVERAQHMILHARNQTYRPHKLAHLIERDRLLFENWTHDASVIPSEFFCYWRHRFERRRSQMAAKFADWQGDGYFAHCDGLLERISQQGALMSRDLERPESGVQEMWQWHDGKAALEYLWRTGTLCIAARRNGFQKVYDLVEHGLPVSCYDKRVGGDEFIDWACRSALDRLGFATAGDIARFWDHVTVTEARAWLEDQGEDRVIPLEVGCYNANETKLFSARADIATSVGTVPPVPARLRVLSPFDPVIRDRKRLSWLFGFDYRIEIYVPESKRRWGYYVFPLLEGDRLVGRIDMRADRKADVLEVKRLWLEPKVRFSAGRRKRLASELVRQARLAGVRQVVWLDGAEAGLTS